MTYTKPSLKGLAAIAAIQATGTNAKSRSTFEPQTTLPSQPAYEADE